jgi:virulence-associated protein VagC
MATRCDIRGCTGDATNKVLIKHPMRDPFRVDLCGYHLTITSSNATITISPLNQSGRETGLVRRVVDESHGSTQQPGFEMAHSGPHSFEPTDVLGPETS